MKRHFLIFIFCSFFIEFSGQTVDYNYDACGNRILRQIIILQTNTNTVDTTLTENYFNDKKDTNNVAIEDFLGKIKIKIYPNPVNNSLRVTIENCEKETNILYKLYDYNGKQIKQEPVHNKEFYIDFLNFPNGNYILVLYINNEKREYKIIKI